MIPWIRHTWNGCPNKSVVHCFIYVQMDLICACGMISNPILKDWLVFWKPDCWLLSTLFFILLNWMQYCWWFRTIIWLLGNLDYLTDYLPKSNKMKKFLILMLVWGFVCNRFYAQVKTNIPNCQLCNKDWILMKSHQMNESKSKISYLNANYKKLFFSEAWSSILS